MTLQLETNQNVTNTIALAAIELDKGFVTSCEDLIFDAIVLYFNNDDNVEEFINWVKNYHPIVDKTQKNSFPVSSGSYRIAQLAMTANPRIQNLGEEVGYADLVLSTLLEDFPSDTITSMIDLFSLIIDNSLRDVIIDGEKVVDRNHRGFNVSDARLTLPNETRRIALNVNSTIVDNNSGQTVTYELFGKEANRDFLEVMFQKEDVVAGVQEFFLSNRMEGLIQKLLGGKTQTHFVGSKLGSYTDVLDAVKVYVSDYETRLTISELIMAYVADEETGFINTNRKYSYVISYPEKRVSIEDLRSHIVLTNVSEAISGINYKLKARTRVSVRVYAENISKVFEPIGLVLQDTQKFDSILDDIIIGIKNVIDPVQRKTKGTIPLGWRNHEVVHALSDNWVFINAALALSSKRATTLTNDTYTLDKWAPAVLASLRTSSRYSIVSKSEFLSSIGTIKIKDMAGVPKSCILYRDAKIEKVAQALYAHKQEFGNDFVNIYPTKEPLASDIQAAYGNLDFSIGKLAGDSAEIFSYLIEQGYVPRYDLYLMDTSHAFVNLNEVAAFACEQLYVTIDSNGKIKQSDLSLGADIGEFSPEWWFRSKRSELSYKLRNATLSSEMFYTQDPVEFFMASEAFDSKQSVSHKNQLLGHNAFNSTLTNYDIDVRLSKVATRFPFIIRLDGGQTCHGALDSSTLTATRGSENLFLVKPMFDASVISGFEEAFNLIYDEISEIAKDASNWSTGFVSEGAITISKRILAQKFMDLAKAVSPSFRAEIHQLIVEASINGLIRSNSTDYSASQVDALRSRLSQNTIGAMTDIHALYYLMHLQGFELKGLKQMIDNEEVKLLCLSAGSDRPALDF